MPVYCGNNLDSGVEDFEEKGLLPPKENVTLDFGNGVVHHHFVKHMTYFMNTSLLMQQLHREVNHLNISVEIKSINSFEEVDEEIVINCTGLGSMELNSDLQLISVRGHLIALKECAGKEHLNYIICTRVNQDERYEFLHLFPKNLLVSEDNPNGIACAGVFGGTFLPEKQKLAPKEQQEADQLEFQRLLDRHSLFFLGHPFISTSSLNDEF